MQMRCPSLNPKHKQFASPDVGTTNRGDFAVADPGGRCGAVRTHMMRRHEPNDTALGIADSDEVLVINPIKGDPAPAVCDVAFACYSNTVNEN